MKTCVTNSLRWQSGFLILSLFIFNIACLDRINIDTGYYPTYPVPIVVDGFISDGPGPYVIKITSAYDVEAKESFRYGISVKKLLIFDDHGTSEILRELSRGIYSTSPNGIRGTVGRAYTIRFEVGDGRIYESKPDTLYPTGKVDSIYFKFRSDPADKYVPNQGSTKHGFDVFFNAKSSDGSSFQFLWKYTATFKVTLPCCTCWASFTNSVPIVSDGQLTSGGRFNAIRAEYLPIDGYTFMYKVHVNIDQLSLSRQSFDFWRAVRAQKLAANNVFQPITGKIPSNFIQISGQDSELMGIFFATSISSKAIYIARNDVPRDIVIPKLELAPGQENKKCNDYFPNSSSLQPSFWTD